MTHTITQARRVNRSIRYCPIKDHSLLLSTRSPVSGVPKEKLWVPKYFAVAPNISQNHGTPNLSAFGFVGSFKQFSKAAALNPGANNKLGSKLLE